MPAESGGGRVELSGVTKRYDGVTVVNGVDLDIAAGEFFSLLGPSGCGKTTTLRMIGGFETLDAGTLRIDGVDMRAVPAERRPVNTVFQSYALFPHLNVADNVAFGLRFNDVAKSERTRRVGEALELVQLGEFAARKPHQLSGGQQQRVALARALVLQPKVLLLDEPLGALDAKLRRALQGELMALHRAVGITFVYVTHDQDEAMTMSDRLAVMRGGDIVQIGTPTDVYRSPANAYVADFLGLANLLPAARLDDTRVTCLGRDITVDATSVPTADCTLFVRPERLGLVDPSAGLFRGAVVDVQFTGSVTHVRVDVRGHLMHVVVANDGERWIPAPGTDVGVSCPADAWRVLER